jgi:hypothetical protein
MVGPADLLLRWRGHRSLQVAEHPGLEHLEDFAYAKRSRGNCPPYTHMHQHRDHRDREPPVLLRALLGEAAEAVDVRVLLWAGAPVPVFAPRRSSVREGRDELVRGTRIQAALDSNERPMHCHHEKLVVIDDEVALSAVSTWRISAVIAVTRPSIRGGADGLA